MQAQFTTGAQIKNAAHIKIFFHLAFILITCTHGAGLCNWVTGQVWLADYYVFPVGARDGLRQPYRRVGK
jgi:hypothetical protein